MRAPCCLIRKVDGMADLDATASYSLKAQGQQSFYYAQYAEVIPIVKSETTTLEEANVSQSQLPSVAFRSWS